jgi:Na+/serine symporter
LVQPLHQQGVGLLLVPLDTAFFAIDSDVEVVLFADGDLGAMQNAFGTAFEAE